MKVIDIKPRVLLKTTTKQKKLYLFQISLITFIIFFSAGTALSYFTDVEVYVNNILRAALLDFDLSANDFLPVADVDDMDAGDTVSRDVKVVDDDSTPFKYKVRAEQTGGDNEFCEALELTANLEGSTVFSNKLLDFNYSSVDFGNAGDEWTFHVSLPFSAEDFGNVSCSFDFVYEAWQANLFYIPAGFSDVERISNEVRSKKDHGVCDDDDDENDDDDDKDEDDDNDKDEDDEDDEDGDDHRGHRRRSRHNANGSGGNGGNGGIIITGNACASATIINVVNTNVAEISGGGGENINIENNNSAVVENNVEVSAETGGNSANGGDSTATDQ
ncbi:hypothetical protein HYT00_03585 [Candidatus Giovannonibacteria bacterium]|nr:hypothetical protein [Candidatus Giovannonibacteria bacterium]